MVGSSKKKKKKKKKRHFSKSFPVSKIRPTVSSLKDEKRTVPPPHGTKEDNII